MAIAVVAKKPFQSSKGAYGNMTSSHDLPTEFMGPVTYFASYWIKK